MPEPSKNASKKRKIEDPQGADHPTSEVADEPFPGAENIDGGRGIQVRGPLALDWDALIDDRLGPLMDERKALFKRLADVNGRIKEVMKQGSQY